MKSYLGDAVYASDKINPGHITLTTGSPEPYDAADIIHLEPQVLDELIKFAEASKRFALETEANALISLLPEDLQWKAEIYSNTQIDINNLEHDEALLVMRALNAGRWERKESGVGGKLDYVAKIDGWTVRLWAAGPPDSCRVVEEEYEIPAVPASIGKRTRVICNKAETPEPPTTKL